jgi:helix-turn-helix protein
MGERSVGARQLWRLLEPIHAVVYFSPEPLQALREAGYRGFWMGYFANRAAPLGPAGPGVVHALFYNFSWARVARALPSAWKFAPPAVALEARERGSVAALRRQLGTSADGPEVHRAAELASRAAVAAPVEGRVLFAANRELPEPSEPLARLWQAATLLREHRGDGHIAALMTAGIGGRASHVFHALVHGTPRRVYELARDFDDEEWSLCVEALRSRGLVDEAGVTQAGTDLALEIEEHTDELAMSAYDVLSEAEREELVTLLRPMARAVVQAGEIPLDSPMGLDLRTL